MHVSTKDSSNDGATHVLTSVIEADGPSELCSTKDKLSGEVLSVTRTPSGGIEVVTKVSLNKKPASVPQKKAEAPAEPQPKPQSDPKPAAAPDKEKDNEQPAPAKK